MKNNILSINEYRNNPEFYFTKGLRLANKKNLSEAYRNLMKALELEPDNSEYKFNMACFLSELQRPSEANRMFSDILINFDPKMFDCFFGLGCNSFEEGNNEKAAEFFDKYLYFDAEGEFSYEISEMAFYLKLYSEVSHDNKFLKTSENYYKKACKFVKEENAEKAISYLYKAIQANPLNVEARNNLTLCLLQKGQYIRAQYINSTVKVIDPENIWGNCLCIYLLNNSKKKAEFQLNLDLLPYRPISNREELLCVVTTLIVFGKFHELIKLMETYAVEYNDQFIYSVLMLAYIMTENSLKAEELKVVLDTYSVINPDLGVFISFICNRDNHNDILNSFSEQYKQILSVTKEPYNIKYFPAYYYSLKDIQSKPKLPRKYTAIIEGSMRNREIMYSRLYKKEIIGILSSVVEGLTEPIRPENGSYDMYSAALEYNYCRLFNIKMKKEELISKYGITTTQLNNALKVISFI